jgi:crotonobetainyl-CoA:carnitine CoA-transferase CaiB-like acyl-CoA transferase
MAPVQTLKTRDGWIYVMGMLDKFWEELARRIGRDDLLGDPRFASAAARHDNRDALTRVLDAEMQRKTTAEWLGVLGGGLPVAPVYDVAEAIASPFLQAAGLVQTVPHPVNADFKMLANPLRIDGVRPEQRVCSALGADNDTLVGERPTQSAAE